MNELYLRKRVLAELHKSQWLNRRDLETIQLERMRALLKHAYDSVPYYHRMMNERRIKPEDIRSLRDISRLPVLKKEEVRIHVRDMISSKYQLTDLEELWTSGSTSIPLKVFVCLEQRVYSFASRIRNLSWMNVKQTNKSVYIGPPIPKHLTSRWLYLDSWEVTVEKLESLVNDIRRFRPKLLWGFPSSLNLLAKLCEERGIDDVVIQIILSVGEKLFDDEKKRMENIFHSEVFENYSAQDAGFIGGDCSNHSGIHICSESMFLELLRDGEPAAEGEAASIVLTPLYSYGMPLIRYEMEDVAHLVNDACPCGRGLPLMSYVDGRITDILVLPNGRLICGMDFEATIFRHIDVKQYRIIQESASSIVVELIPGEAYTEKSEKFMTEVIKEDLGEEVEVSVRLRDKIEPPSSGKRRTVISHVPLKL